jgi:hypothetical protein
MFPRRNNTLYLADNRDVDGRHHVGVHAHHGQRSPGEHRGSVALLIPSARELVGTIIETRHN